VLRGRGGLSGAVAGDELESQLAALEQKFDAIDVLASAGFVARKKTGRRPTEKQEAPA
jgi:hypothetical protein